MLRQQRTVTFILTEFSHLLAYGITSYNDTPTSSGPGRTLSFDYSNDIETVHLFQKNNGVLLFPEIVNKLTEWLLTTEFDIVIKSFRKKSR